MIAHAPFDPQKEALAFRIWQFAEARGWDCTSREIADALDVSVQRVAGIASVRGWTSKLRAVCQVNNSPVHKPGHVAGFRELHFEHPEVSIAPYRALARRGVGR